MYKPDDKDIDRVSRDAAEQYHAPGKPDWSALQQTLDKELPQEEEKKRRGFFFFFFLLIGLSLAGSGVWYGIHINNKNKPSTLITASGVTDRNNAGVTPGKSASLQTSGTNTVSAEKNTPVSGSSSTHPNSTVNNSDGLTPGSSASGTPEKNSADDRKLIAVAEQRNTSNNNSSKTATPLTEKSRTPLNNNNGTINNRTALTTIHAATALQKSKQVKNNIAATTDKAVISNGEKIFTRSRSQKNTDKKRNGATHGTAGSKKPVLQQTNAPVDADELNTDIAATSSGTGNMQKDAGINSLDQPLPAALADAAAADTTAITAKDSTQEKAMAVTGKKDTAATAKKKDKSKNNKAILVGLTAGLDISTIKLTYGDNAGYNIGLMGGYQFSKHWSVYTGLIYTKKNYKLDGVDFHPPKHYWTQYVKLQTVEGYCRMWEVPLLARYTFNPGSKTPFFVSAGLSSYFMKKQQYNYSYKNNMNQPMTGTWGTDSSFNHAFSIVHLSGGFEKRIGKHMNWQIEPYAKIPLGGVGFGSIRLSSFGINFSVQYRQPVKR